MYISDTNNPHRNMAKKGFIYLLVSIFCVLFGFVYECFSHEVYSFYMIYAFMIPLIGGVIPFYGMALYGIRRVPKRLSINLYNSGIGTLTVGSIFKGVLEIYGTSNRMVIFYWFVGIGFLCAGVLLYLIGCCQKKNQK